MSSTVVVFRTDDAERLAAARQIRDEVFCREQNVSPALEWDGKDDAATHFVLLQDGHPVATARTRPYGPGTWKVERVAVLKPARGTGAGREIMAAVLAFLRRQRPPLRALLHAQTEVAAFYERLGFVRFGETFEEAGIPHIAMEIGDISACTPRRS